MKQKKKNTTVKKKKHADEFSDNLQENSDVKKQPSKPLPEFIGPDAPNFIDEHDAPVINPNQDKRL